MLDFVSISGLHNEIVGSVSVTVDSFKKTGFFCNLFVVKEHRRKKIASELVKFGLKELREALKIKDFSCTIKDVNASSIAFFEKLGFRRVCRYEDDGFIFSLHI